MAVFFLREIQQSPIVSCLLRAPLLFSIIRLIVVPQCGSPYYHNVGPRAMTQDQNLTSMIREKQDLSRARIRREVRKELSDDMAERLLLSALDRVIAATLKNPNPFQLELLIGGEPFPIEDIYDIELLEKRGRQAIKRSATIAAYGHACLARAKYLREEQRRK